MQCNEFVAEYLFKVLGLCSNLIVKSLAVGWSKKFGGKGTSVCFISEIFVEPKLGESVNAVICQIAALTLYRKGETRRMQLVW